MLATLQITRLFEPCQTDANVVANVICIKCQPTVSLTILSESVIVKHHLGGIIPGITKI